MNLSSRMSRRSLVVFVLLLVQIDSAQAWIYPEHRDIGVLAVERLDPERKALFDTMWAEARKGHEERLCSMAADTQQGLAPSCIDWAALPAIAGDHSCSGRDLVEAAEKSPWILTVADVAAQLKADLARIGVSAAPSQRDASKSPIQDLQRYVENESVRADRVNALRTADTRLQRADPAYATRAGSNGAHFLLPRARTDQSAREYAQMTLTPGADINALGVYGWYHLSALQTATRLAHEQLAPAERQALTHAMLIDEAFAIHFLEDTFSAGHVAGAWGDASQRKGTHDYYNEAGIEAFFWRGASDSAVLTGDAHMRPQDAERAAAAVRESLEEVIDVAAGRPRTAAMPYTPKAAPLPDGFDVCKNDVLVQREEGQRVTPEAIELVAEVLASTPIPSLGPGLGSLPRFRAEVGPFVGIAGSTGLRNVNGGFVVGQDQRGWIGDVDLAVRAGLGLDGVLGDAGDGLIYVSLGLRGDSASTNKVSRSALAEQAGSLSAAIPSRMGISTRIRMPYYLIPGDLLLAAPLYFVSPTTYTNMAVTASNGGLIPWQQGLATSIGRFQFVLGRELGVTFYGRLGTNSLVAPANGAGTTPTVVNFKSIAYELPILEYRPYRAFDTRQSSAALFQLFVGADVPHGD
ncbi:MAG TPA: hypothetical protein VGI48_03300, partial [Caldimonas sp.]